MRNFLLKLKKKLVKLIQNQIAAFEEKIMTSTDEQLSGLARECGVDDTVAPKGKGRDASIAILLKYGRVQ